MQINDNDVKQLAVLGAKFMLDAKQHGHSMALVELDPAKLLGLAHGQSSGAGKMMVVIAAGDSIETVKAAIAMAERPH